MNKKADSIPAAKFFHATWILSWTLAAALLAAGCSPDIYPLPTNTVNVTAKDSINSFDQAEPLTLSVNEPVRIDGTLSWAGDVDVFALGDLQPGQTVSVTVNGKSIFQNSDIVVGLFNQDGEVAVLDENIVNTTTGQNVELTIRESGNYYLAITVFSTPGLGGFNYRMTVTLGTGEIAAVGNQIVYINFATAGDVTIGTETFSNLLPFSNLPNNFGTLEIAGKITDQVREYYSNFNIRFLSSCTDPEPTEPHTVVFVCANIAKYYGLADQIDWYNQDPDDHAVVFTGLLAVSRLNENQFVMATANVIAHELGHLVGLVHTTDHAELMDQSTPLAYLVKYQDFHRAQLPQSEFPIGYEDTAELLEFSLGVLQP